MQAYNKAIGSGIGSVVGTVAGGSLAANLPVMLPDGSPWYAYIIGYTIAGLLPIVSAVVGAYFAPANKPS